MQESDYIKEVLANVALKGFCFNEKGRVIPKFEIQEADYYSIKSFLGTVCGKDATDLLNTVCKTYSGLITNYYADICMADINKGDLIKLTTADKQNIVLLYLGDLKFTVCSDSCFTLKPFDTLLCVSLGVKLGNDAYFRVVRNKKYYPDSELLLCLKCIQKIEVSNSRIKGNFTHFDCPKLETHKIIYANKSRKSLPYGFSVDDFTISESSVFKINLEQQTFVINAEYLDKNSIDDKTMKDIEKVCYIDKRKKTIETLQEGSFYFSDDMKDLIVSQKAKVYL